MASVADLNRMRPEKNAALIAADSGEDVAQLIIDALSSLVAK